MAIFLCKVRKVPRKSPRQVRKSDAGGESLKLFKENGPILGRNGDSNCALEEKALELTFKIGGEGLLALRKALCRLLFSGLRGEAVK